jgi:hypothetical protein
VVGDDIAGHESSKRLEDALRERVGAADIAGSA